MPGKVTSMRDAVATLVRDGDTVAIEGFTHLIGFSAGHEIVRQRKRDLTLARMTPDVIYDQMIAGGVARKLIFSWLGNPGVGGLNAIRRRIEPAGLVGDKPLEIEEYSHFGMVARYTAGATNLPFMPIRSYFETDLPKVNPLIRPIKSPYSEEVVYAVPPLGSWRSRVPKPSAGRNGFSGTGSSDAPGDGRLGSRNRAARPLEPAVRSGVCHADFAEAALRMRCAPRSARRVGRSEPRRRSARGRKPPGRAADPTRRIAWRLPMLWLLIVLVVVLLLVGGGGYRYRTSYPSYYGGGVGIVGLLIIIFLVLLLLGAVRL